MSCRFTRHHRRLHHRAGAFPSLSFQHTPIPFFLLSLFFFVARALVMRRYFPPTPSPALLVEGSGLPRVPRVRRLPIASFPPSRRPTLSFDISLFTLCSFSILSLQAATYPALADAVNTSPYFVVDDASTGAAIFESLMLGSDDLVHGALGVAALSTTYPFASNPGSMSPVSDIASVELKKERKTTTTLRQQFETVSTGGGEGGKETKRRSQEAKGFRKKSKQKALPVYIRRHSFHNRHTTVLFRCRFKVCRRRISQQAGCAHSVLFFVFFPHVCKEQEKGYRLTSNTLVFTCHVVGDAVKRSTTPLPNCGRSWQRERRTPPKSSVC